MGFPGDCYPAIEGSVAFAGLQGSEALAGSVLASSVALAAYAPRRLLKSPV